MPSNFRAPCTSIMFTIVVTWSGGSNAQSPHIQLDVPDLVYSVDISQDGTLVAAGSRGENQSLTVFDIDQGAELWNADAGAWVWDVAFSPDSKWLVSGSDSGLKIWDVRGGRAPSVLPPPPNMLPEVKHLTISPQGNFLAASRGYKIELWDFTRRKMVRLIPSSGGGALAFSPGEKWLAVAGYHNRLKIHDVESGAKVGEIHAQIGILTAVDFSSDGRTLVACSEGVTKIFSLEKNDGDVDLSERAAIRSGLGSDISANGKWLASGGYSGKVSINKIPSGKPLFSFPCGQGKDTACDVKFSEDDTQLVVGGMLGTGPGRKGFVQIWNIRDMMDQTDRKLQN